MSKLPSFVNLELNGNQITEGGVQAVQTLFNAAGKLLGGEYIYTDRSLRKPAVFR